MKQYDRAVRAHRRGELVPAVKKVGAAVAAVLPKATAAAAVLSLAGGRPIDVKVRGIVREIRRRTEQRLKRKLTSQEWLKLAGQYDSFVRQELAAGRDPLRNL